MGPKSWTQTNTNAKSRRLLKTFNIQAQTYPPKRGSSTRFAQQRLAGLFARHQGRPVSKRTPRLEARILAWTRRAPNDGSTHWSSRKLAQALGINHMMVARVWRRAGLKPHRLERYMASDDPEPSESGPAKKIVRPFAPG